MDSTSSYSGKVELEQGTQDEKIAEPRRCPLTSRTRQCVLHNVWTIISPLSVRPQRRIKTGLGRRLKRRCSNGPPSASINAHPHNHELPIPPRHLNHHRHQNALRRRRNRTILPRHDRVFQGPIARFGDTAANAGILALLQPNGFLKQLPSPIQTIFASACAAAFRMLLTPIDTLKTTLQAQGSGGWALLRQRIKTDGIGSLWWGAFATAAATFVGHYPWFAVYNFLSETITEPPKQQIGWWLLRAAFIGFCASVVSDTISNSLRVVKTYRQVNDTRISYTEAAKRVVRQEGRLGLFGRGLKTRIIANGLQGILFSILWKLFLKIWENKTG
ncbi:mitochondrial carrier [Decorospora gaudefroyi]|uniref:Mitochondrial carrier n=1 Tax=Decorospora gaudefroyi TaxID=184978 RepID=A0A6A5JYC2_9PLEO|nr:mitochondrial carrier [Decorospora gaudefroyi]